LAGSSTIAITSSSGVGGGTGSGDGGIGVVPLVICHKERLPFELAQTSQPCPSLVGKNTVVAVVPSDNGSWNCTPAAGLASTAANAAVKLVAKIIERQTSLSR